MNEKLRSLMAARDTAFARAQDLGRAAETRTLTPAEDAECRGALRDVERLGREVEAEEQNIRRTAQDLPTSTQPGDNDGAGSRPQRSEPADYRLARGASWADHVRGRGLDHDPHTRSVDVFGAPEDLDLGKYMRGIVTGRWEDADAERRAMLEGTNTAGGYLLPTVLAGKIIDRARNVAAVLRAGAEIVPMGNRTVDIPKWASDPTPGWRAEASPITESDAALGKVRLNARSLASLTKITRELMEDAPNLEPALIDALAAQFALSIDYAALAGNGTPSNPDAVASNSTDEPVGLLNTPAVTKTNSATALSWDQLLDVQARRAAVNERITGVIYNPGPARVLDGLKDTQGRYLDPPKVLADLPRYPTNQAPAADTFVGDWSQLAVGVRTGFTVSILQERYADTGQIGIIGWWRGDVAVCRASAFEVLVKTAA